eukprot:COSAG01_NODE_777_length_13689_cov_18.035467_3_plen_165_part_00
MRALVCSNRASFFMGLIRKREAGAGTNKDLTLPHFDPSASAATSRRQGGGHTPAGKAGYEKRQMYTRKDGESGKQARKSAGWVRGGGGGGGGGGRGRGGRGRGRGGRGRGGGRGGGRGRGGAQRGGRGRASAGARNGFAVSQQQAEAGEGGSRAGIRDHELANM